MTPQIVLDCLGLQRHRRKAVRELQSLEQACASATHKIQDALLNGTLHVGQEVQYMCKVYKVQSNGEITLVQE